MKRRALPGLRAPAGDVAPRRQAPQARRGHARRQPALGQGRGEDSAYGHRAGADKISPFLGWCEERASRWSPCGCSRPTTSTAREAELTPLLGIIEDVVAELAATQAWRLNPVGALDLLPDETAQRSRRPPTRPGDVDGLLVNVAVGYGGRREIADAVRSLLQEHAAQGTTIEELAEILDVEHIAEHLYTKGQPDPDLVIRTSGEQRLGGFLLWQSAHTEFYFCEASGRTSAASTSSVRCARTPTRERRFGG